MTVTESILRFFLPILHSRSTVSSTVNSVRRVCRFLHEAAISGMDICLVGNRGYVMVSGGMAPSSHGVGCALTPKKLLLDPAVRAVEVPVADHLDLHGGYDWPDPQDSASLMPKCSVIYKAHVRGLTLLHSEIPPS